MKTMLLLLAGLTISTAASAQTVIKIQQDEPLTDSITYQNEQVMLVVNRKDLAAFMTGLDTTLRKNKFSNKVYQHVQFSRMGPEDISAHYQKAYCYLEDSTHSDFEFRTDRMNLLWAEDGTLLIPYLEEMLPQLLVDGRLKVIERSNKQAVPAYKVFYEQIDSRPYQIFRLNNGKEIFRESAVYVEQMVRRG